ncbi:MAG TPA: hypothetical protein VHV30_09100 [Polyangiaceae bacterium]|jgi:hypothetical protein|nr:hypothetical protein [Polyangiaceae bacterium]
MGALVAAAGACSASSAPPAALDASAAADGSALVEAGAGDDAGSSTPPEAGASGVEGGDANANGDVDGSGEGGLPADRFVTNVVSFTPGACAGFGRNGFPAVVEGPPEGGGSDHGSTDVLSLGTGGSIVVGFGDNAIVDGPGPDFIVFENPFWVAGDANEVFAEPGEVSVSDDGVTWRTYPCTPAVDPSDTLGTGDMPPYGSCAGWHVVDSNTANGVSPVDPATAGGDAFDLADLGVTHAKFVRIVDKTHEDCPDANAPNDDGFDLDAVSIVNAERP